MSNPYICAGQEEDEITVTHEEGTFQHDGICLMCLCLAAVSGIDNDANSIITIDGGQLLFPVSYGTGETTKTAVKGWGRQQAAGLYWCKKIALSFELLSIMFVRLLEQASILCIALH
jgi:hypothetical protein